MWPEKICRQANFSVRQLLSHHDLFNKTSIHRKMKTFKLIKKVFAKQLYSKLCNFWFVNSFHLMTIAPKRKEVMQNFEISFSLGKATKMLSVDITSKNEVRGGGN